jgi:hypothetical protein
MFCKHSLYQSEAVHLNERISADVLQIFSVSDVGSWPERVQLMFYKYSL